MLINVRKCVYIYLCVVLCVCEREREREREGSIVYHYLCFVYLA